MELAVGALVKYAAINPSYRALPKFPAITRDLAVLLPENIAATTVAEAIIANAGDTTYQCSIVRCLYWAAGGKGVSQSGFFTDFPS